jgi:hypothetical protein
MEKVIYPVTVQNHQREVPEDAVTEAKDGAGKEHAIIVVKQVINQKIVPIQRRNKDPKTCQRKVLMTMMTNSLQFSLKKESSNQMLKSQIITLKDNNLKIQKNLMKMIRNLLKNSN